MDKPSLLGLLQKEINLTHQQIEIVEKTAQLSDKSIEDILLELDFATADEIAEVKAIYYELPLVDLKTLKAEPEALRLIKESDALKRTILPLSIDRNTLNIAVDGLENIKNINGLERMTKMNFKFFIAQKTDHTPYKNRLL